MTAMKTSKIKLLLIVSGFFVLIVSFLLLKTEIQLEDGQVSLRLKNQVSDDASDSSSEIAFAEPDGELPVPDLLANLAPSPLNALLKKGLSPAEQVGIVGQMLNDYWMHVRSLPTGTPEEIHAALAGANKRNMKLVPADHPALGEHGFHSNSEHSIRLHVISSRKGVFQLIHCGGDRKHYTDDDLISNYPPDLASLQPKPSSEKTQFP